MLNLQCVKVRLHGLISNLIKLSKKVGVYNFLFMFCHIGFFVFDSYQILLNLRQKRSLMLSTAEVQHCVVISNQELWKKMITRDKEVKIKNLKNLFSFLIHFNEELSSF